MSNHLPSVKFKLPCLLTSYSTEPLFFLSSTPLFEFGFFHHQFRVLMGVARLMLEQIDRGRTIEYSRKKSLSADEGIMDYK